MSSSSSHSNKTPKRRLSTSSSLALKQSKQPIIGLDLSLSLPSFTHSSRLSHSVNPHHHSSAATIGDDDDGLVNGHGSSVGSSSYIKLKKEKGMLFPCSSCPKIYRSPACLAKHSWSHSLVRPLLSYRPSLFLRYRILAGRKKIFLDENVS